MDFQLELIILRRNRRNHLPLLQSLLLPLLLLPQNHSPQSRRVQLLLLQLLCLSLLHQDQDQDQEADQAIVVILRKAGLFLNADAGTDT